jgi:hypothetical protein
MQTLTTIIQWSAITFVAYIGISTAFVGTPGFFA